MTDFNKDAILELFEFDKKSVLCCAIDEEYITGLINRGAKLWFREADRKEIVKLDVFKDGYIMLSDSDESLGENNEINFHDKDSTNKFDYSIVDDLQYDNVINNQSVLVEKYIVIVVNKLKVIKWIFKLKSSLNNQNRSIYSVVPSLKRVKLILPEELDVPIERYWTLRNSNPYKCFKLILEWVFIKNNLLRKIFSDKLIVIKC